MQRPATLFAAERARLLEVRTVRRTGASVSQFVRPEAFAAAYRAAQGSLQKGERVEVVTSC